MRPSLSAPGSSSHADGSPLDTDPIPLFHRHIFCVGNLNDETVLTKYIQACPPTTDIAFTLKHPCKLPFDTGADLKCEY